MASKIDIKHSSSPGAIPTTSSINLGEFAINTYDGKVYIKKDNGTESIIEIGSGSGGGGGTPGGPNTSIQFNGNGVFSGSSNLTFNSGSNTVYLSGSLNITGSSTIAGYTQFMPVVTNIDTSISASYIYVSGSTNDLYFSQNGNGYNNVTRLRWLEGNLYTGLLNGGIISASIGGTTYQVGSGSGIIVNLNASYNANPYPTIQYLNWPNLSASIAPLSASYDQSFVGINSSLQITASGIPFTDGEYNTLIPIGIVIHQNRSTINAAQTFPSVAYGWKQRSFDFIKAFGPLKISGYDLTPSSSLGLLLNGGVSWVDGRNYTVDPNNPSYIVETTGITTSKIYYYHQSGSGWVYNTNNGAGYSDITASLYSNSGSLTPVPTNNWSLQRVFYFPNSATKAFYIYYGNAVYSSKDNAIAGILTEPFNEAPNTAANAIFVGYMILRHNADFTTAASYEFRAGGLFRGISGGGGGTAGGGSTTLAGLTDVTITSPTYGDLLMYDTTVWNNTKTLSGSYTVSGSLNVINGITGSLLGTATTASYALNGGVTQLLAGPNISLSPTNGLGQVTITSTGGGGGSFNTATGSYGSFYDTTIQNITTAGAVYSMSLDTTDISNGVSISGSTNPYNTYIKMANAGVYDIQFSAQIDKTTGTNSVVYIWLRKNGIDLAETNTAVTLAGGANDKATAAWNWFVNAAAGDYFQLIWAGTNNNVRLFSTGSGIIDAAPAIPSLIVTANRIDQFLSNTGSFSGSFNGSHTGSFTGSFTGSLLGTATTASYVLQAVSSSFATTASYYRETDPVFTAISGTFAITGSNRFNGNQTITGSLLISGSSATIIGNTTITGSLFTSGSSIILTPALVATSTSQSYFLITGSIQQVQTASAQIYGVNIAPTMIFTTGSQTNTTLRVAPTFSGSAANSASQNNIIADFGATSVGTQFSVNDITSGSIYMVNDVSGLPIIEALSDWTVNMYNYPTRIFQKTGSVINITGTQNILPTTGSTSVALTISGSNTKGGAAYLDFLQVTNTTGSATNPNKYFRLDNSGSLQILRSDYGLNILQLSDAGNLYVYGATAAVSSNSDGVSGSLMFNNNHSQIYDDGNMHIHSRTSGDSMWINTNNAPINLLHQAPLSGGATGSGVSIGSGSLIGYVTINNSKSYTTSANYGYLTTSGAGTYPGGSQTVNISLYATQRIWGQEIDAFSDERMKDIQGEISLEDGLRLIKTLKPIKYTWKEGNDKGLKAGYSAQQVIKAGFDHLIGLIPKEGLEETIDDDGFMSPKDTQFSMNYDQVTPYHGVVIKHLLEKIEQLEQEIQLLKNK